MFKTLLTVATLLMSVMLVMAGHGLQNTVIPLRASYAGFSDTMIGLAASTYSVGFVIGCLAAPYAIVRAGHIRAFAALISVGSAIALLHAMIVDPWAWVLFRSINGFCIAGFFIIIESWLNDRSENNERGFVLSTYVILGNAAIIVGQLTVAFGDIATFVLFGIASIVVSFAVVPVAMTKSVQPAPVTLVRFRPRQLYETSPTAFIAILLIGALIGTIMTLAPLYATGIGLSTRMAAIFASMFFIGGLIMQWPLGRASDLTDRRFLLILCSMVTIVIALVLSFGSSLPLFAVLGLSALVGAFLMPTYAIASAHAFDYAEPEDYVETSSGILLMYGIGGSIGPIIGATLMQWFGPQAMFHFAAFLMAIMAIFLLMRISLRTAMPAEEKEDFDYAAASPVVGTGHEEAYENEDQLLAPNAVESWGEADDLDGPEDEPVPQL